MPIISGKDLNEAQRRDVLTRFINRDTVESPYNNFARFILGTSDKVPTDAEWIAARRFVIGRDGKVERVALSLEVG